eukprot:TRINITY_DN735_c0_g1_i1.p1 TRINITY_DN735_c0_g1~~TRINITY_DN735_c0_g1_i1.p1  ORF type:complete len:125 (-),score=11.18 TRINITY_DN735_c0_g1_i1:73-408(-)
MKLNSVAVMHYIQAFMRRPEVKESLKESKVRSIIFSSEDSAYYDDCLSISAASPDTVDVVNIPNCGTMIALEKPELIYEPLRLFFQGLGLKGPDAVFPLSPPPDSKGKADE